MEDALEFSSGLSSTHLMVQAFLYQHKPVFHYYQFIKDKMPIYSTCLISHYFTYHNLELAHDPAGQAF